MTSLRRGKGKENGESSRASMGVPSGGSVGIAGARDDQVCHLRPMISYAFCSALIPSAFSIQHSAFEMSRKPKQPVPRAAAKAREPARVVTPESARAHLEAGRFREAIAGFKDLLKQGPTEDSRLGLAAAYAGRAGQLADKGMLKEALVMWENRAALGRVPWRLEHAVALLRLGRIDQVMPMLAWGVIQRLRRRCQPITHCGRWPGLPRRRWMPIVPATTRRLPRRSRPSLFALPTAIWSKS